jgi:hypothetical protein
MCLLDAGDMVDCLNRPLEAPDCTSIWDLDEGGLETESRSVNCGTPKRKGRQRLRPACAYRATFDSPALSARGVCRHTFARTDDECGAIRDILIVAYAAYWIENFPPCKVASC